MQNNRVLKVGEQSTRPTRHRRIINFHPKINLSGKWLQNAGFCIGEQVRIIVEENYIRIEKLTAEPTAAEPQEETETDYTLAFTSFLDALYWEGYTEEIASGNPDLYNFELNDFLHNYTNQSKN